MSLLGEEPPRYATKRTFSASTTKAYGEPRPRTPAPIVTSTNDQIAQYVSAPLLRAIEASQRVYQRAAPIAQLGAEYAATRSKGGQLLSPEAANPIIRNRRTSIADPIRSAAGPLLDAVQSIPRGIRANPMKPQGAGEAYEIARTDVPYADRVQQAAGTVAETAASIPAPTDLVPGLDTRPVRKQAAEFLAESLIPTEVWDTALALMPLAKARTAAEVVSALALGDADAIKAIRNAGKRLGQSETVEKGLAKLASEYGGGTPLDPLGDAAARAGDAVDGLPASTADNLPSSPVPVSGARELEQTPVDKLRVALKSVGQAGLGETARARTDELRKPEYAQRFKQLGDKLINATSEAETAAARSAAMSGEMQKVTFEGVRDLLDQPTIDELFTAINESAIQEGNKLSAQAGLWNLLAGEPPQPSQIRDMEAAGIGVRDFLPRNQSEWDAWRIAGELANLPRTLVATADLSASLRQAIFLAPSHPIEYGKAFAAQVKAFSSEQRALQIEDALRGEKLRPLMDQVGVYFAPIADANVASLNKREEQFMSSLANKIPGFGRLSRASERGYGTMLNKLRSDVFSTIWNSWDESEQTLDAARNLALYVNNATGRGNLGKGEQARATLNALFFSPGFQASRLQLVTDLTRPTQNPLVRKQAMRDWVAFVGAGMTALALADISPWMDVEVDPRNANFGKIRLGNTTLDFWAGMQQPARYTAQLISGERKITGKDGIYTIDQSSWQDRANIFGRYVRSKLAPVPSLLTDFGAGEQISGQPLTVKDTLIGRITPLAWQDIYESVDAYRKQGPEGYAKAAALGGLSFLGAGAQTYDPSEPPTKTVEHEKLLGDFPKIADDLYKQDAWQEALAGVDPQITPDQYDNFEDWKEAVVEDTAESYLTSTNPDGSKMFNYSKEVAKDKAQQAVTDLPLLKTWSQTVQAMQTNHWRMNPQALVAAVDGGALSYNSLNKEEKALYDSLSSGVQ